jgi:hypothetical protein
MGTCPGYVTVINTSSSRSHSLRAPSWRTTRSRLLSPTSEVSSSTQVTQGAPTPADRPTASLHRPSGSSRSYVLASLRALHLDQRRRSGARPHPEGLAAPDRWRGSSTAPTAARPPSATASGSSCSRSGGTTVTQIGTSPCSPAEPTVRDGPSDTGRPMARPACPSCAGPLATASPRASARPGANPRTKIGPRRASWTRRSSLSSTPARPTRGCSAIRGWRGGGEAAGSLRGVTGADRCGRVRA